MEQLKKAVKGLNAPIISFNAAFPNRKPKTVLDYNIHHNQQWLGKMAIAVPYTIFPFCFLPTSELFLFTTKAYFPPFFPLWLQSFFLCLHNFCISKYLVMPFSLDVNILFVLKQTSNPSVLVMFQPGPILGTPTSQGARFVVKRGEIQKMEGRQELGTIHSQGWENDKRVQIQLWLAVCGIHSKDIMNPVY